MQPHELDLPPLNLRNHAMTRFILRRLERSLGIQLRLHGLENQFDLGGGIIVANHFTRLETFVVPFVIHRAVNIIVHILAAPMLFGNEAFGDYLLSIGALPTNYPNKYELIARDIVRGGWWLIFPEGGLIKDRKVLEGGKLHIATESGNRRRRPRSGAAVLAMMVQQYKAAIQQTLQQGTDIGPMCEALGLTTIPEAELLALAYRPTPIVPLNITYYPLNPQDNALKSIVNYLLPNLDASAFGQQLLEEFTVEGSMLLKGVEIDMRLGKPLLVVDEDIQHLDDWRIMPWSSSPWRRYLNAFRAWRPAQRYTHLLDRWTAMQDWRQQRRTWQITRTVMHTLYQLTTVNMDHLLSVLLLQSLRTTQQRRFSVTELKRRLYLAVHALQDATDFALHPTLTDPEMQYLLLADEPHPAIEDFARRASRHGLITCQDDVWIPDADVLLEPFSWGTVRLKNFIQVYYNEVEPLPELIQAVRYAMHADLAAQQSLLSDTMFTHEQHLYEADYNAFATSATYGKILPLPPDRGRPVLLHGHGEAGHIGVLLMHGYSASPGEVLPLAHALNEQGLTVYVVRLRGHGTSPYDLQRRKWLDWYDSVRRGYAALRTISDVQFAGGMSTGGALALYLAARQSQDDIQLQGVFAVGAPIKLQSRAVRLAPLVKTVRGFVSTAPGNPDTNYSAHPVQALHQLTQFISTYNAVLGQIHIPVLLIQARGDPTVRPESAQYIYDRLTAPEKSLLGKNLNQHVIVGHDFPEVHHDILTFVHRHAPSGYLPEDFISAIPTDARQ
jgi:esterase/lipase/1-acyl-sn-glycerol-3-phosphate acyltransferase